jgi:uncharacterized membrane protein YcaP (DUF421 family)
MQIVIRATIIFFFLAVVSRAVGRRELSELTAFELMLMIIVGDLVQQGVTQSDSSMTGAMLAVGSIALWTVLLSYISYKWPKTSTIIEGIPVVVALDGKLIDEALRMERISEEEVLVAARNNGIADMREVRIGIIEADGKFSFVKDPDKRTD